MSDRSLRIAILGSSNYPIQQPFAGGLEAHVYYLARALQQRGHHVSLFAAQGSSVDLVAELLPVRTLELSPVSAADPSTMPNAVREHHAYLSVMLELAGIRSNSFDIVHNHSLHYLPIAMSATLPVPMVTTLHTPPFAWLESAVAIAPQRANTFAAVSEFVADQWRPVAPDVSVVRNGIPVDDWPAGPGGDYAVWSGRIVPEKGTHHAIEAARTAGVPLRIAGPISNPDYFRTEVEPLLDDTITYVGHLRQKALAELVGGAAVALVTPVWTEPYGLVVAEALACGTPVASFRQGGIPEILSPACGVLVDPGDSAALATAIPQAAALSRSAARARAESFCSIEAMIDSYVDLYGAVIRGREVGLERSIA